MSRVRVEALAAGLAASIQAADGRWLRLHSIADPQGEADRLVQAAFADGCPASLIVVGLGLGFVLDAIERRSANTRVLAIEPFPDTLEAMWARRPWSAWTDTGRLRLLVAPAYDGAGEAFRHLDAKAGEPPVIVQPVLRRAWPGDVERACAVARSIAVGALGNEHARRQFAGRYLLNTLANLPAIAGESDVAALAGLFRRVPAIVVGAGPSLDANLEGIRAAAAGALIIAVDTASRPLMTAGIVPDAVVSVDPQPANGKHLLDLPPPGRPWLIAEASLDPVVFPAFVGRTFLCRVADHEPWPWLTRLGVTKALVRAWGSVLTTAFDVACTLGCDPVVFAGADLAYTHGLLYCWNTTYEPGWSHLATVAERAVAARRWIDGRPGLMEPDVEGRLTETTPTFVQFRDWIVRRSTDEHGRRILNATGGGILHGGAIVQTSWQDLRFELTGVDRAETAERFTKAWTRGLAPGAVVRQLEERLRGLPDGEAELLGAWLAFGGDTVNRDDLIACLSTVQARCSRP